MEFCSGAPPITSHKSHVVCLMPGSQGCRFEKCRDAVSCSLTGQELRGACQCSPRVPSSCTAMTMGGWTYSQREEEADVGRLAPVIYKLPQWVGQGTCMRRAQAQATLKPKAPPNSRHVLPLRGGHCPLVPTRPDPPLRTLQINIATESSEDGTHSKYKDARGEAALLVVVRDKRGHLAT